MANSNERRIGLLTKEQIIQLDHLIDSRGLREVFDRALIRKISKKLESKVTDDQLPMLYLLIDTIFNILKDEQQG